MKKRAQFQMLVLGKLSVMNRGSTLLEALIALAAIVVVLSATSALVITSLSNSIFTRDQNQANKLAQQGMEYIRSTASNTSGYERYVGFASNPSSSIQCMNEIDPENPIVNPIFKPGTCSNANIDNAYKRDALFQISENCAINTVALKVTVTVYWQSGKCTINNSFCHKQVVSSCFSPPSTIHPTGI